jgi:hypothetical protein
MSKNKKIIVSLLLIILSSVMMMACGVLNVRGRTFVFDSVEIDWGLASEEDKESIYEEFLVSNEIELLNVLRTRNNRHNRITSFGTNGEYTTVNTDNEILDKGYYRQDGEIVTLAETEDGFSEEGNYTLKVNSKGYYTNDKINSEFQVFARYFYVMQN